jgi:hypothetical protein
MHHTMATAWAVVHVIVVHQRRLLADDILGLNYLISIHFLSFLFIVESLLFKVDSWTSQAAKPSPLQALLPIERITYKL